MWTPGPLPATDGLLGWGQAGFHCLLSAQGATLERSPYFRCFDIVLSSSGAGSQGDGSWDWEELAMSPSLTQDWLWLGQNTVPKTSCWWSEQQLLPLPALQH